MLFKAIVLCALAVFVQAAYAYEAELSQDEISWIGGRIFANECSSNNNLLVQWNEGEDFLSLGIGHFIWYPEDRKGPFEEGFPEFLEHAKASGAAIPAWLEQDISQPCPWPAKEYFLKKSERAKIEGLRNFLESTKPLQAEFIIKRFNNNLPLLIESISDKSQKGRIIRHIERLRSTAQGTYALIDYSNFKGMGVLPAERYNGKGWGLLQVLSGMKDEDIAPDAAREFSDSADRILTDRVENSPASRNEQRWLPGWRNRVRTYTNY